MDFSPFAFFSWEISLFDEKEIVYVPCKILHVQMATIYETRHISTFLHVNQQDQMSSQNWSDGLHSCRFHLENISAHFLKMK